MLIDLFCVDEFCLNFNVVGLICVECKKHVFLQDFEVKISCIYAVSVCNFRE